MNCWDVLGLARTRDRDEIERAYEQQRKFAEGEERSRLDQAYREALAEAGLEAPRQAAPQQPSPSRPDSAAGVSPEQELDSREHQIARETVVQVNALLNDDRRSQDVNIWRAILTEPPADQPHIRRHIGEKLEHQLRPLAENGAFGPDVTLFLGDWFGWDGASRKAHHQAEDLASERGTEAREEGEVPEKPQMVQFWPAILGWIVGLIILTSLFSNMGGG